MGRARLALLRRGRGGEGERFGQRVLVLEDDEALLEDRAVHHLRPSVVVARSRGDVSFEAGDDRRETGGLLLVVEGPVLPFAGGADERVERLLGGRVLHQRRVVLALGGLEPLVVLDDVVGVEGLLDDLRRRTRRRRDDLDDAERAAEQDDDEEPELERGPDGPLLEVRLPTIGAGHVQLLPKLSKIRKTLL